MPVVTRQVSSVRGTKSSRPVPPPVLGVIRVPPEPVLPGFTANETPLLTKFADKRHISMSNGRRRYSLWREFFKVRMTVLMPIFSVLAVSRTPAPFEGHFSDQLFNARLTGLISVSELKNAVAVTAAKSVMAFRVLTMAVDLCRLTTRTMNVNAGHERTSKARIIHQIQLIRGIT
ncbi:hypothetical protein Asd1617_05637 [Shigella dysenteriae 1617]|uniref:Uncharacterized protein n=1 Tax=Shigella dysenteriae 1617 TaxID=754093 RepID=A0A0A7A346_SHIDY|nr:hypothetical protein Asd1617_05637 [Shigella dysenteriae 1617]